MNRATLFVSLSIMLVTIACAAPGGVPAPTASAPTAAKTVIVPNPTVDLIGSTRREVGSQTEERIEQNNCGGSNDVSQTIKRSRTIERTLDLGSEFTVEAGGQVGLLGANVNLGVSIANSLGYSYGSSETVERSITLQATPGKNTEHNISLQEIWEVGEARVVVASQAITLPFRFRSDFAVNLVESVDVRCSAAEATSTPQATDISAPTGQPLATPESIMTVIGPAFLDGTYLISGTQAASFSLGDELVVYDQVAGTEIAIALLKVIVQNPDSLTAQEILIHTNRSIRPTQRVDGNRAFLSTSELVPAAPYAVGYIRNEDSIRLRPNSGVKQGSVLEALELEVENQVILDALPFSPPLLLLVTAVGASGNIARIEPIEEDDRATVGMLVRFTEKTVPTSTSTHTATATANVTSIPSPTIFPVRTSLTSTPTSTETYTPGPTPTVIATPPPLTATPTVSATPIPTSTSTRVIVPTPIGAPILVSPEANESIDVNQRTTFSWKWQGELQSNQGFEVLIWRDGTFDSGAHDAQMTKGITPDANGIYSISLNIENAAGVNGNGEYNWSIALVQLSPKYLRIDNSAPAYKITISGFNGQIEKGCAPKCPNPANSP